MKKKISYNDNNEKLSIEREKLRERLIDEAIILCRKGWDSYVDLDLYIDPDTYKIYEMSGAGIPCSVWEGHDLHIIGYEGGPESLLTAVIFESMIESMDYFLTEVEREQVKKYQEEKGCNLQAYEDLFPELYEDVLKEFQDETLELEMDEIEARVDEILDILYARKTRK